MDFDSITFMSWLFSRYTKFGNFFFAQLTWATIQVISLFYTVQKTFIDLIRFFGNLDRTVQAIFSCRESPVTYTKWSL